MQCLPDLSSNKAEKKRKREREIFSTVVFTENELAQHGKRVVIFKQAHYIPLESNGIHIQVNSLGHGADHERMYLKGTAVVSH